MFVLILNYLFIIHGNTTPDGYLEGYAFFRNADWQLATGRWANRFVNMITGNVVFPLLSILISIVANYLVSILLIRLWNIHNKFNQALVGLSIAIAPALVCQYLYTYSILAFSLSLFLSSFSVFILFVNSISKWKKFIISIICMSIALGCYQAYIGFSIAVVIITIILKAFNGLSLKDSIRKLVFCIFSVICGCALYLIILKVNLIIFGVELSNYGGADNIGIWNSLTKLPQSCLQAYKSFIDYFTVDAKLYGWLFIIPFILFGTIFLVRLMIKKGNWEGNAFVAALVLSLPLSMNCVIIVAPDRNLYTVMLHQLQLIIPFVLAIEEQNEFTNKQIKQIFKKAPKLFATLFCWTCLIAGFCTHYSMVFASNYHTSTIQTMLTRSSEIADPAKTRMLIAGAPDESFQKSNKLYKFSYYTNSTAVWSNNEYHICEGWRKYLTENFGYDSGVISHDEFCDIINSEKFERMNLYPNEGSIKLFNDIIVVKLEDLTTEISTMN